MPTLTTANDIRLGTTSVSKVYVGGEQVWPTVPAPIDMWLSRSVLTGGSVDPNGTSSHTCTFTPATNGNLLVVIVAGSVTCTTPAGWSLLTSAVNYTGLYVFTKTASGGESSFTTTHNDSNYAIRGIVYEFSAGTTTIGSNAQTNVVGGGAISGPHLAGLTGTYAAFAARSHGLDLPNSTIDVTWTAPANEDYEEYVGAGDEQGIGLSIAYQSGLTAGSFSCEYSMTWDNTANDSGESVVFALSV